jgi:glycosyltransferase involved in cell wall biosynthesis
MNKILYIITQSELGGAQKNVLDLACGLKDKYEILVAAGPDGGGDFFRALKENRIKYIQLKFMRRAVKPLSDVLAIFELKKLIKKERPDIIHLHSSKAGFSGSIAAKISGVKAIYTVHGAVFEAAFSTLARKFYLWLEKLSSRFKDKIICVSENDKKLWLKYDVAPAEKLIMVHNGIDYKNLDFLPKETAREKLLAATLRYENPLSPPFTKGGLGRIFIGTIANLYPEKGLPYFIQAATEILKKYPNLVFMIIGEGPQRPLLEEMIKQNHLQNKFLLAGKVENAPSYLRAFDFFVLPSIKEGFPYTILEAMAAELPIVASYVGGIPEMIENEKNGFLVLPKNPQMLADRIEKILLDDQLTLRFSEKSRQKIADFSLEKMIAETEKVYQNL